MVTINDDPVPTPSPTPSFPVLGQRYESVQTDPVPGPPSLRGGRGQRDGVATASPIHGTETSHNTYPALSPDCHAGKHTACTGDAWDDHTDQLTGCICLCHEKAA